MTLPALLSHALVAFTVEFDNEFEHRMPHRTTARAGPGPWLVSMAMWYNCMRFVDHHGIPVAGLERRARTWTNLNGMLRWGYITVSPDRVVHATAKGRRAQDVWQPLAAEIEQRWESRFGRREVEDLRDLLRTPDRQIHLPLPDCLPILKHGLYSRVETQTTSAAEPASQELPALFARILLLFAIEFERNPGLSLAISANVLRILDDEGVRVRDLPALSGVSKEAINMAMGILEKGGFAVVETDTSGRPTKITRLTPKGVKAQAAFHKRIAVLEEAWQDRYSNPTPDALRQRLASLSFLDGLTPYPDGWRATVPTPQTLPHYPMVLHRGGYPDGS
jgi:DNA-binding MarR family transcriptional regulator